MVANDKRVFYLFGMEGIKNVIFDLGDVLLDLDWERTERAFRDLLQTDFDAALRKYEATRLFERLEVGTISPEEFLDAMKKATQLPVREQDILLCWNSILVTLPSRRIQWLQELGQQYQLFLLSNTNAIHIQWLDRHLRENMNIRLDDFNALFVKPYYSFEINMRKPNQEIYEFVIEDAGLQADETLFVDDSEENILSAQSLGIRTLHHQAGKEIIDLFRDTMKRSKPA